jgi:hypothetical protein
MISISKKYAESSGTGDFSWGELAQAKGLIFSPSPATNLVGVEDGGTILNIRISFRHAVFNADLGPAGRTEGWKTVSIS